MREAIADSKEDLETSVLMMQSGEEIECGEVELEDEDIQSLEQAD